MLDDPHTQRLWDQAKGMTGDVNGDAVRAAGFRSVLDLDRCSDSVRATIAAACVQAAAHIFAALVQADLASEIREARRDQGSPDVLKNMDPLIRDSWDEAVALNVILTDAYKNTILSQGTLAALGAASFQATVATFDTILKHKRAQP